MRLAVKYVTCRRNGNGQLRWYWQRPGHKLVRLPDSEPDRVAMALRLNAEAEDRKPPPIDPATTKGTIAWLIAEYRQHERFTSRARKTRVAYNVWLKRLERMWGEFPAGAVSRALIVDWIESIPTAGNRLLAAAVLRRLLVLAKYYGLVEVNHAEKLELSRPQRRTQFFSNEDARRWLEAAGGCARPAQMRLAFALLLYTGQRPGDCLRMPWSRYNGSHIELRQQKTHKLMAVPCHRDLKAVLDAAKAERGLSTLIVGRGLSYTSFRRFWNEIRAAAELEHLQARDLRRTTVVKLGEAGCTEIEISSITGHSLADVKSILDSVYLVRTDPMAVAAITKWENANGTESNAALESRPAKAQKSS